MADTFAEHNQHEAPASGCVPIRSDDHSLARRACVPNSTLVVGLGSSHGDDQAGWLVASELQRRADHSRSLNCHLAKSPSDLLDWLDDVTHLILCDACDDPTQLGTLSQWHWPAERFVRTRSSSSHQLGLPEVLDLAAALHRLPERVELWTIAGANFSPGSEPSAAVRSACEQLARQLSEERARA